MNPIEQNEENERYIQVVSPQNSRIRTRSGRLVQPPRRLVPLRKPDGTIDMAHIRVRIIDEQCLDEKDEAEVSDSYEYESESEEESGSSDLENFIVNDSEDERHESDSSYTCSSTNEEESEDFTEYEEESSDGG